MYAVYAQLTYLVTSVALTVWVARTLVTHGRVFLVDSFRGNAALADSVNHLLAVGFYLTNVGYVALALRFGDKPTDLLGAIEFTSTKIGLVLIVLGVMHFANMALFTTMRRRALERADVPPVLPDAYLAPRTA